MLKLVFTILLGCLALAMNLDSKTANVVITSAERKVNVNAQLIVEKIILKIKNENPIKVNGFYLALTEDNRDKLSYIKVSDKSGNEHSYQIIENLEI